MKGRKSKEYLTPQNDLITLASEKTSLSPEVLEVCSVYLTEAEMSVQKTAQLLDLPTEKVSSILANRNVSNFINSIFWSEGYRSRKKLFETFERIIEAKLEEAEETEIYSNKDLVEIIEKYYKMMVEFQKLDRQEPVINATQRNNTFISTGGENINGLLEQLLKK